MVLGKLALGLVGTRMVAWPGSVERVVGLEGSLPDLPCCCGPCKATASDMTCMYSVKRSVGGSRDPCFTYTAAVQAKSVLSYLGDIYTILIGGHTNTPESSTTSQDVKVQTISHPTRLTRFIVAFGGTLGR